MTRAGAHAVFVLHDHPELIRSTMLDGIDCPFPVLVDVDRAAYDAWGLRRASAARIWLDPKVWRQYVDLLRAGHRLRRMGRDVRQLGGDFVIGPDQTVVYARPQRRDDRPAVGELLAAIERVA